VDSYFATEAQTKAKNWDKRTQYRAEKAQLARLENELQNLATGLQKLAAVCRDHRSKRLKFVGQELIVLRPRLPGELNPRQIDSLSLKVLDVDSFKRLLRDIKRTRKMLTELTSALKELGVLE